ncbi:MAG: hypothetical protein WAV54_03615 [Acidimicrobiales bacterium]
MASTIEPGGDLGRVEANQPPDLDVGDAIDPLSFVAVIEVDSAAPRRSQADVVGSQSDQVTPA